MFRRKGLLSSTGRNVGLATVAALIFTLAEPPKAAAGSSVPASSGISATAPSSNDTDFSGRRRSYRHYRGGNAAGLAMMGMMIGTIGAIAAQQRRDDYYYYNGPGYYGPGYAYGPPVHYGYGPYYGRRYYRYYPY